MALLLFCAMIWALPTAPAGAVTIAAVDWATIDPIKGAPYAGPTSPASNFVTTPVTGSLVIGALTGQVWKNDAGLFTYLFTVDPQGTRDITEFNTGFGVLGFNDTAGYSFADAALAAMGGAGGNGSNAFLLTQDPDGTLDWNVKTKVLVAGFWDLPGPPINQLVPIRFFFQSTMEPGSGLFNINAGYAASAENYAPSAVPEPSSLLLLGSGLMGLGLLAHRKFKTTG